MPPWTRTMPSRMETTVGDIGSPPDPTEQDGEFCLFLIVVAKNLAVQALTLGAGVKQFGIANASEPLTAEIRYLF